MLSDIGMNKLFAEVVAPKVIYPFELIEHVVWFVPLKLNVKPIGIVLAVTVSSHPEAIAVVPAIVV